MPYQLLSKYFATYPDDVAARQNIQHFGRTATDWASCIADMEVEREPCLPGESIKMIYFVRHGHAVHNPLPIPTKPHWPGLLLQERSNKVLDPPLTPVGEEQTAMLADRVKREIAEGMPAPTKVFTSIARRTCQTAVQVWARETGNGLIEAVHDLRDRLNGHTFTQLTRLSEKKALFPLIRFGRGLPDEDVLALSTGGTESHKALKTRARQVWEYMWERSQGHDCISIVAHQDPLLVFWTDVFGLDPPNYEKAESRAVVVKYTP